MDDTFTPPISRIDDDEVEEESATRRKSTAAADPDPPLCSDSHAHKLTMIVVDEVNELMEF